MSVISPPFFYLFQNQKILIIVRFIIFVELAPESVGPDTTEPPVPLPPPEPPLPPAAPPLLLLPDPAELDAGVVLAAAVLLMRLIAAFETASE